MTRLGSSINHSTSRDRTNYFEVVAQGMKAVGVPPARRGHDNFISADSTSPFGAREDVMEVLRPDDVLPER